MEYPHLFSQVSIFQNQTRAKHTILLFRIVLFITLLNFVLNLSTFRSIKHNDEVPILALLVNGIFGLIAFVPHLLLIIFFILWMSRAYQNLHKSGIDNLQFTEGWAVAAWFVPFLNLVRPFVIVKEIWNKTQEAYRHGRPFERKKDDIISYWWSAYIFSGVIGGIASILLREKHWEAGYFIGMLSNVMTLFAILYGTKMVRDISGLEKEMLNRAEEIYAFQLSETARKYVENRSIKENIASSIPQNVNEEERIEEYVLSDEFVDNSERSRFLILGFQLLIGCAFLYGAICFYVISESNIDNYFQIMRAADKWLGPISMIGFVVFCITGIILILWMKRAYSNLHHLNIKGLSYKPETVIYSWFIPIGNLFIPYNILQDINRATQEAITQIKNSARKSVPNYTLIIFFWLSFILSGFFLLMSFFSLGLLFYNQVIISFFYGIIAATTGIIAFYMGTVVVKNISFLENELFQKVEEFHSKEIMSDEEEIQESEDHFDS